MKWQHEIIFEKLINIEFFFKAFPARFREIKDEAADAGVFSQDNDTSEAILYFSGKIYTKPIIFQVNKETGPSCIVLGRTLFRAEFTEIMLMVMSHEKKFPHINEYKP